jgi:hypothetical protein
VNSAIRHSVALTALTIAVLFAACSGRDPAGLEVARARIDPVVFHDDYSDDVHFEPFANTHYTAVELDSVHAYGGNGHEGARSLKINIPPQGSALGAYSGGVLVSGASRDLTEFNALTFYARTDVAGISLNTAGFGNDNSGASLYAVGRERVPIAQDWTFVVVPIPAPSKLIAERGMLTFAEALEEAPGQPGVPLYPNGYNLWFDEIRFAKLDNLSVALSFIGSSIRRYFVGSTVGLADGITRFDAPQGLIQLSHSSRYYDLSSSDPSVARPVARGEIKIVGEGTANIFGALEGFNAGGTVIMNGYLPPTRAAARPTLPAGRVISMFSDAYEDVPIDTWRTDWSVAEFENYLVAGQKTKMYTDLNYVGVDFTSALIDATEMSYFHLDVYAPFGTKFILKLVSFPGDLSSSLETAMEFRADTTPAFNAGSWSALEIALTDFDLPAGWDWSRMGQLVFQGSFDVQLVLVDNVYWHE